VKRAAFSVALLLLVAASAFATTRTILVVDDVIRMTKAGVADDTIVAFVKNSADAFEINGDDVLAMTDAHVSPAVLKFVVDESGARMKQMHSHALSAAAERGADRGGPPPENGEYGSNDSQVIVHSYGAPYYYSDPYYYSPYYYGYPYYGYPYWGIGIGFGYTYYGGSYGHYYGHGGYGHGHGGGHYGGGGHGGGGHGGGGHGGGGGGHHGGGGSGGHSGGGGGHGGGGHGGGGHGGHGR